MADRAPAQSVDVWRDDYRVHSYEVDSRGSAHLSALCNYMQESAWRHAERLGLGFSELGRRRLIWLLARQRIVIEAFPKWGDTLTIRTWPSGNDRVFCYRDFKILNASKAIIGKATSAWFVIDTVSRKPQPTESYFHLSTPAAVERVFAARLSKLAPRPAAFKSQIRVGHRDLDINGHVNNTRYIDWLLAGLDLDFLQAHTLEHLEINYLAEALYNDEVSIGHTGHGEQSGPGLFHSLTRPRDNVPICRAETVWRKAA